MKKFTLSAIALVAAAVAAPAFAQSSVTLYGRLNTSVENQKFNNDARKWVVQNNSSRIGFKGTEDMGGGLKASFQLEHGFGSDTGQAAGTFWGREAWVQLAGAFGAIRLGNITPESYFATADYVSMHNHDTGTSSDALYSNEFSVAYLNKNKVMYMTPAMGGFSASVAMTAGEKVEKNGTDVAMNYDVGPFHGGFGYSKQGNVNQWALRALYEMGPVVLGGYYQKVDVGSAKQDVWRLAAMYAMGASEFHVNYGASDKAGSVAPKKDQWTLGYNYNLSKRTKVYAFYTKNDLNKDTGAADNEFTSLAMGVRHNF